MFALLDLLGARSANRYFEERFQDRSEYYKIEVLPTLEASGDPEVWLCFTGFLKPEINLNHAWGAHNLLPKRGKIIVVNGPDAIAGYTPHDSVRAMTLLEGVVSRIIAAHSGFSINIFSISAGTYPGFYFANRHRAKKLVAVAPGPRMGEGIYTSCFSASLRNRCIESGFPDAASYDAVISRFNQENNILNLPAGKELLIFGGGCDRVILNWGTREIAEKCRMKGKAPLFRNYLALDHTSLGGWLALSNKFGLDPYGISSGSERTSIGF